MCLVPNRLKFAGFRYYTPVQNQLCVLHFTERGTLNPGLLSIVVSDTFRKRGLPMGSINHALPFSYAIF